MANFLSIGQVEELATQTNKILMIKGQEVLDVTAIAMHHPGKKWLMQVEQDCQVEQDW